MSKVTTQIVIVKIVPLLNKPYLSELLSIGHEYRRDAVEVAA